MRRPSEYPGAVGTPVGPKAGQLVLPRFKGRQGSPTGRTLLLSPAMVVAAALAGHVTDVRKV